MQDRAEHVGRGELAGRVAVITGAGRGIGRAIAEAMARSGASVVLLSRTGEELVEVAEGIAARGGTAVPLTADITSEEQVERAFAEVFSRFEHVDLLVNNAGTNLALGLPWEVDPEAWWTDVETSLLGPFLCTRAVGRAMVERGSGRIINVSSGAATEPRPYTSGYAAVKTGAQRYTESVAVPFLEHGVRVFSLNPGPVRTTLLDEGQRSEAGRRFAQSISVAQYLPAERAAGHAVFLASGRGDALVGRYLSVFDDLEEVLADERLADPEFLTLRVKGWRGLP